MSIKGNWRLHGSEVVIRWCQRFFSRRFATLLRGFAAQFCRPQREKNLWHPGYNNKGETKLFSGNSELLDFAFGLVDSILHLPWWTGYGFLEVNLRIILLFIEIKELFWFWFLICELCLGENFFRLVKMTVGLVLNLKLKLAQRTINGN